MTKHRKRRQAYRTSLNIKRPKSRHMSNQGLWLMIGMLMGIIGVTTIFLFVTGKWPLDTFNLNAFLKSPNVMASNHHNQTTVTNPAKTKRKLVKASPIKTVTPKKEPARFEFYQLLPGMEVPLPDTTTETASNKSIALANAINKPKSMPLETITETQETLKNQEMRVSQPLSKPMLAKTEKKIAAAQYLVQAGNFRALGNAELLKKHLYSCGLSAKIQKIEAKDGVWFRVTLGPFSSETIALSQKNRLAKEKIPGILILQRQ